MRSSYLVDSILEEITKVINTGASRVLVCALYRVSCEGWLKVELLKALTGTFVGKSDVELLPEIDDIDLTVKAAEQQVYIELKTFPTNYGGGGKPITNFIDGVIHDLSKLELRSGANSVGLVVWLAYPIPEPPPPPWLKHLERVEAASAGTLRIERLLLYENKFAHMYIMRSKPHDGEPRSAQS